MKRTCIAKMLFLCMLMMIMTSCSTSRQDTTPSDAQSVVAALPDFQRQVQYLSVEAVNFGLPIRVPLTRLHESLPKLADSETDFIHEIVYQTKGGTLKLILLNDAQPPRIVGGRELK